VNGGTIIFHVDYINVQLGPHCNWWVYIIKSVHASTLPWVHVIVLSLPLTLQQLFRIVYIIQKKSETPFLTVNAICDIFMLENIFNMIKIFSEYLSHYS